MLNHKLVTFGGSIVVLVASLFLAPVVGFSFLPDDEQKLVYLTYTPKAGQTRDQVVENVDEIEQIVSKNKEVETIQTSIGGQNPLNPGSSNSALMFIIYDPDTKDFATKSESL